MEQTYKQANALRRKTAVDWPSALLLWEARRLERLLAEKHKAAMEIRLIRQRAYERAKRYHSAAS